jgi:hypothetical protein
MIVSRSRGFIFVHIHKTAGEAVTQALEPYLAPGDLVLGGSKAGNLRSLYWRRRHALDKHSPARAIRAFVGAEAWERSLTFAFVRDPVERMRSLHAFFARMAAKRRTPGPHNLAYTLPGLRHGDPLSWPGLQAYLASGSFSEFIRQPRLYDDPGARPQLDMVSADGRIIVERIGRFERLADDFAELAADLGLAAAALARVNISRSGNEQAVSAEDRAWLYARYAGDVAAFGYA